MAICIHNCADLPHLDTQVKALKPAIYSMAYYPLIPGSPSPKEVIGKGYADNCLMAGKIDPQLFVRGTIEKMQKTTMNLIAGGQDRAVPEGSALPVRASPPAARSRRR